MRTLGIIPARGGSKGLPGKNIRTLNGKPLIAWTIEQARASASLDLTVVSTDDEETAAIARRHGGHVPFLRPPELALDDTPIIDVVRHLLTALEPDRFDVVALCEPTSPLRRPGDIDGAIRLLAARYDEADAVISVGEVHTENPHICKVIEGDLIKPFVEGQPTPYQRQRARPVFFPYGVIYAAKRDLLVAHGTFYLDRALPFFLERWQNYEIDDICDFLCVETIMRRGRGAECEAR
jgi:CMP-N,N'-diacetyllegionaminic acid synthase